MTMTRTPTPRPTEADLASVFEQLGGLGLHYPNDHQLLAEMDALGAEEVARLLAGGHYSERQAALARYYVDRVRQAESDALAKRALKASEDQARWSKAAVVVSVIALVISIVGVALSN